MPCCNGYGSVRYKQFTYAKYPVLHPHKIAGKPYIVPPQYFSSGRTLSFTAPFYIVDRAADFCKVFVELASGAAKKLLIAFAVLII